MDLPVPSAGLPDFVVHRARFDAALAAGSPSGGVQAYWRTEGGGGAWWVGQVQADRRPAGDLGVRADPMGCGGLWERFEVAWTEPPRQEPAAEGAPPPAPLSTDPTRHAPWELFPVGADAAAARAEAPSLPPAAAARAAAAVEAAAGHDRWAVFQAAPEWDEAYRSGAGRQEYYNRRVAVPLALMEISARLHLGYYRQAAALEHDVRTVAANAAAFHGAGSAIAADARAMEAFLLAAVGGEEGGDVEAYAALADVEQREEEGEGEGEERDGDDDAQEQGRERRLRSRRPGGGDVPREPAGGRPRRRAAARAPGAEERQGAAAAGGRYGLRHAGRRVAYDDVDPGSDSEGEGESGQGWGGGGRQRAAAAPVLHAYSTRRAQPVLASQEDGAHEEEQQRQQPPARPIILRVRPPAPPPGDEGANSG